MNRTALVSGAGAALALSLLGCSSVVQSGAAVGKVGHSLAAQSRTAPQGAEACALQEALSALPGTEKPMSDVCGKAAKSDLLWRRSLGVLAAYGQSLETLAHGGEHAGQLEAALTGVSGGDWISVDGAAEQAARDAAAALVKQMADNQAQGDLGRAIKDAAPHVKTICDGLGSALESAAKSFADLQKEAEKKRTSHTDRRCGTAAGTNLCVGESSVDRMVYGNVFAQAALLESTHLETRDTVAGFCAAHRKLEAAAADGNLSKDATYADIVAAVKAAQHAASPSAGAETKPGAKPAKK